MPRCSAIRGLEEPTATWGCRAFPTGAERPALSAEIPHARKKHFGILRTHRNHGAAGRRIWAFQDFAPGLAAVGGLVEATVVAVAPKLSGHTRVNRVAVFRIHENPGNALRIRQSHVVPTVATIGRFVDAVANRGAIARPGFAGAHPDGLWRLRIDRNRANGLHRFLVEYRLESGAAVDGFPDAAAGGSHVNGQPPALCDRGDGRDAAAHRGGTNVSRAQTGDGI